VSEPAAIPPRFLADAMLGRLARWLRALGFDTAYDPALDDPQLVRLAAREARVLLTRDRHLVEHLRPERALLVRARAPLDQLREVLAAYGTPPDGRRFTRCLVCNAELEEVAPEDAAGALPPSAASRPGPLRRCPGCERVYWPGSHVRRMREALDRALGRRGP
jgi:uncharacterized protein with PIN domain